MKSSKKWYWAALLLAVLVLVTAATRVKGDSATPALERFQADGIAVVSANGGSLNGTIKGNEIGTAMIVDNGYSGSSLGITGNGPDSCVLGGGNITITAADGSTLTMVRSGIDCDISGTGVTSGNSGNHIYIITGGTGRFTRAVGGGNYTFSINKGAVLIHIDGNIQAPRDMDHD